jgi:hypothetical protein
MFNVYKTAIQKSLTIPDYIQQQEVKNKYNLFNIVSLNFNKELYDRNEKFMYTRFLQYLNSNKYGAVLMYQNKLGSWSITYIEKLKTSQEIHLKRKKEWRRYVLNLLNINKVSESTVSTKFTYNAITRDGYKIKYYYAVQSSPKLFIDEYDEEIIIPEKK